jgi:tetratricopeptide (TPR) repeat protein
MSYEKLSAELADKIDEKMKQAGDALRAGDPQGDEAALFEAWALIPEPKFKWSYYPQIISGNFVTHYRDLGQFDKAKHWLEIVRQAYAPPNEASDDHIGFLQGTVLYEAGDHDQAFELFDKLYKKYRKKFFEGEDKKYLNFYLARRK